MMLYNIVIKHIVQFSVYQEESLESTILWCSRESSKHRYSVSRRIRQRKILLKLICSQHWFFLKS